MTNCCKSPLRHISNENLMKPTYLNTLVAAPHSVILIFSPISAKTQNLRKKNRSLVHHNCNNYQLCHATTPNHFLLSLCHSLHARWLPSKPTNTNPHPFKNTLVLNPSSPQRSPLPLQNPCLRTHGSNPFAPKRGPISSGKPC